MTRLYLVRHGRASAAWNSDPDPGLDQLGLQQSQQVADRLQPLGPMPVVTSPLLRCRQTAIALSAAWSVEPSVDEAVGEIPSPEGVAIADRVDWLRTSMRGTWTQLGERYTSFRDGVAAALLGQQRDTVIFSHFVAINAAIGAATGDDAVVIRNLDNCSVTVFDAVAGALQLVEAGREADTVIG